MESSDKQFLRQAIALAYRARQQGGDPFGAVLVMDGLVVHQARDRSVELSDPTFHAELSVISEYCRAQGRFSLEGYTLYTSTEPCVMCAGAIHWARISRLVYSVSQTTLQELSGGRPKPSSRGLLNSGWRRVEVVGPLLPEEGLAVFEGYTFVPKIQRHEAQWGGGRSECGEGA